MSSRKPPIERDPQLFADRCSHSKLLGLMASTASRRARSHEELLEQARYLGIVEAAS